MAKEIELKLSVSDAGVDVLSQIERCFCQLELDLSLQNKLLSNVYFDTPDKLLNQYRMALRIRKKGDEYIQTLKTKGRSIDGLSERGEWEWQRPDASLDLEVMKALDVWPQSIDLARLQHAFETNFMRYQVVLEWDGGEIELAFDEGEVFAQGKSLPIRELELELRSGEVAALKSFADVLGSYISLRPSDISKAERGYSLMQED